MDGPTPTGPLITLPRGGLVLLVGPAGSGKTTFAARCFGPTQVVSSDELRARVADDPADQRATPDAFAVMRLLVAARLRRGRLAVIDATNVLRASRRALLTLAEASRRPAAAVVFDLPLETCLRWNATRADRRVPADVVVRHHRALQRALPGLHEEGFASLFVLASPDEVARAAVVESDAPPPRPAER